MDLPETTRPRLLWVTDPWETLDHPRDTTLRIIEEAVRMGVGSYWADVRSVQWDGHATRVDAYEVMNVKPTRTADAFHRAARGPCAVSDFEFVLYRPDPPVDLAYLHPLQLLSFASAPARCRIVNPPHVLWSQSEKLVARLVADRMPPTTVASQWETLRAFGLSEGKVIAKPMHQCQSKEVELLDFGSSAARDRSRAVLEQLTCGFARPVVLQRFLPEVVDGETRVWFLDGAVLGVVRKKAADGSYRIDMDKGGMLVPHVLTASERAAVPALSRWLTENGVRFAAIDLIDGWITDFNFTSPGLIPSMELVLGRNLAAPIVEALASPSPRPMAQPNRSDAPFAARSALPPTA